MQNSIETVLSDIKKLFKELELAYGEVKPLFCNIESAFDKCPNSKCWVQRIRDEQSDRIIEMERAILTTINDLNEFQKGSIKPEDIQNIIKKLDYVINPSPCQDCIKYNTCNNDAYKNSAIHEDSCVEFVDKKNSKEETLKVAIQF